MRAIAASSLKQVIRSCTGPSCRRSFATSSRLDASYGFIGLGRMGECLASRRDGGGTDNG
jgi:3-hydroxyisobutyrate dehydrogenase